MQTVNTHEASHRNPVHRDPRAGAYENVAAYREGEGIAPLSAPGRAFRVDDAFPHFSSAPVPDLEC